MKPVLLIVYLLLLSPFAWSQQQSEKVMSLEECIAYALENSVDVKNAFLDEDIAAARVRETRGIGLPQVNANVSLQHNEKLRRIFFQTPSQFVPTGTDPEIDALPDGSVIAAQNFFQLKSSGEAGLNIDQLLFNGSYLVGLQAAQAYKNLTIKTTNQTKEQIIENVKKAYYAVLINNERINLFNTNIARVDTLFRDTKAMFENGFAESIDVDRVKVTLNNLVTERDKFLNLQTLSVELLKFQMNYPMREPLQVSGSIETLDFAKDLLELQQNWDYAERPDYQVLEANKKLQQLNIKNNYATGLPSLSAFANLGYATQSADIAGLFKTETDFDGNSMIGPDKWYPYSTFGVSLNIPIFSGLQRTYKIQQEKITLMKIENGFTSLKSGIDLEIKTSTVNYNNAIRTVESQKENMELATKIARVTKVKYEEGVGSNFEVIDAESSLKEAQVNYYNALYDALLAKVDLEKAYGKILPNESK